MDALGAGVDQLEVGQRVVTGGTFGVWAEYFVADAAGLIRVPDAVPDESAAQLVSMPFSALSLLHSLDLREGDWLIQNAANGAVGRMVAQLGAARGINVVGLVRRAEGVEELRAQGIERVIATDSDDWRDRLEQIDRRRPHPGRCRLGRRLGGRRDRVGAGDERHSRRVRRDGLADAPDRLR